MTQYRVTIIDNQLLVCKTWVDYITYHTAHQVAGSFCSAAQGRAGMQKAVTDILLLGNTLPDMNEQEAVAFFRQQVPEVLIIAVSWQTSPGYVQKIMRLGAMGYVTKASPMQTLDIAINRVGQGSRFVSAEVAQTNSAHSLDDSKLVPDDLTNREREVLRLLKTGISLPDIAGSLSLPVQTVDVHQFNILRKLGLNNSLALVDYLNKQIGQY